MFEKYSSGVKYGKHLAHSNDIPMVKIRDLIANTIKLLHVYHP